MAYPKLAQRDCEECRQWVYDPEEKGGMKTIFAATGKPIRRPPNARPPCSMCKKTEGAPPEQRTMAAGKRATLSLRNLRTLARYYEHKAAGGVVHDPVTRRNFGIIEAMFDFCQRDQMAALFSMAGRPA